MFISSECAGLRWARTEISGFCTATSMTYVEGSLWPIIYYFRICLHELMEKGLKKVVASGVKNLHWDISLALVTREHREFRRGTGSISTNKGSTLIVR